MRSFASVGSSLTVHGLGRFGSVARMTVVDRINARYRLAPYEPWSDDGTLPEAGLLIHCFDGHEALETPWSPTSTSLYEYTPCTNCMPHVSWDLSTSLIFADQTRALSGGPNPKGHAPVDFLFGGGCGGGLIFRPGVTRVRCGNAQDCGGYCHELCPDTSDTPDEPPACPLTLSWAPKDVHAYLRRETRVRRGGAYRNNVYNEFIIDGQQWNSQLPHSIDAFIMGTVGSEGAKHAAEVHARFLAKYGLSAEEVPLLAVTGSATNAFRVAPRA